MAKKKDTPKVPHRKGTITVTVVKTIDELGSTVGVTVDAQGVIADTDEISGLMMAAIFRVFAQTKATIPDGETEH